MQRALQQALSHLISYNYGAERFARMKQFVNLMLWVAVGSGVITVIVVNIFAAPLIQIFNNDDPVFFAAAKLGLRLHLAAVFLDGLIFCAGVFFQSLGLGRKATFVTMANMLIQLPFLLVLPMFLGVKGIWLAVPLSNIVLSFVVLVMMGAEWKKLGLCKKTSSHASLLVKPGKTKRRLINQLDTKAFEQAQCL